ncbi:MAG TPA: hypothetical protein VMU19_12700 [Bryobacteraceae bacterium]|nr:hypothetical protein [Bryobacteraceae bacterium]
MPRSALAFGTLILALLCALPVWGATEIKDVSVRCAASAKDSKLVESSSSLVLDDAASSFTIRMERPQRHAYTVPYADIQKVIAEVSTASRVVPGETSALRYYAFYFERKPGVFPERFTVQASSGSAELLAKLRSAFGARVQELAFPLADESDLSRLSDLNTNYTVKVEKPGPAIPAAKKESALVVVVCPWEDDSKKEPINLDANGRVIAAEIPGTYSFVNLDPGDYTMVAQAANARQLRVKMEAGHTYYFFLDPVEGGSRTNLSMHSREMAQFEISGAAYSDWRRDKY